LYLGLGCLLVAGCASVPRPSLAPGALPELSGIDAAELAAAQQPRPVGEVLTINDEMRAFVHRVVPGRASREDQMQRLARAVLHPGTLGLEYLEGATRTAEEAFDTANGNCLALSLLFVALAREAGLDARFYQVRVVPEWKLEGDVVFAARHINVGGRIGPRSTYVMDFSPYVVRRQLSRHRLTDEEAFAQYYNNLGADFIADGNLLSAYLHFRAGLELAPSLSYLWSNIAVVYSRNGQPEVAEKALRRAIALDANNTSAMTNLAGLFRASGREAEAEELVAEVERAQRRNPYYHYALGERAIAREDYLGALTLLRQAISLQPEEILFYERAAETAAQLDQRDVSETYRRKARQLIAEREQHIQRY
jgi:Flp pilus assembly protein TadD